MSESDLPAVNEIADVSHPDYPEDSAIFEDKLSVFPQGCFVLDTMNEEVSGYCFSHPWVGHSAPALNRMLEKLPESPSAYFIHDIAVAQHERRKGHVAKLIPIVLTVARVFRIYRITLVAVNQTERYWARFGFVASLDASLQESVRTKYSEEARFMNLEISPYF